jgi:hypothetical protein
LYWPNNAAILFTKLTFTGEKMAEKMVIPKKLVGARLLKNFGSWMYCDRCEKTIGYLCYTTYRYFRFEFICKCGNHGSFRIGTTPHEMVKANDELIKVKNRLCCKKDKAPLFTIVAKNIVSCDYDVVCNRCNTRYISR